MRRGLFFSFVVHFVVLAFFLLNVPAFIIPEPQITYVNVKLLTAKDVSKSTEKKKAVKTQQSQAPSAPPQKTKEEVKAPKHETKVVSNTSQKKQQVKEKKKEDKPQPVEKQEKVDTDIRPPKLDKTQDKKKVLSDEKAQPKELQEDDFLSALDFIDDLKTDNSGEAEGEEVQETLTEADKSEIATLKKVIERNWFRPPGMNKLDKMTVTVLVKLDRDGKVNRMDVTQSSGNVYFDNSLMRAVRRSSPLPIPADKYNLFKTLELRFNG